MQSAREEIYDIVKYKMKDRIDSRIERSISERLICKISNGIRPFRIIVEKIYEEISILSLIENMNSYQKNKQTGNDK